MFDTQTMPTRHGSNTADSKTTHSAQTMPSEKEAEKWRLEEDGGPAAGQEAAEGQKGSEDTAPAEEESGCEMRCTKPVLIPAPLSVIQATGSFKGIEVPCGKCLACRIARRNEWKLRLWHENSEWKESSFVTLTYAPEHEPEGGNLLKEHLQRFLKRVRFQLGERRIKYFACGEYGETFQRAHYHLIIFGLGSQEKDLLEQCWPFGFVHVGTVTPDSIQYVCGYIAKKLMDEDGKLMYGDRNPPFQLQSQGLGKKYCDEHADQGKKNLDFTMYGKSNGLPRYYKKRYGEEIAGRLQKEALKRENEKREIYASRGEDPADDYLTARLKERRQADINLKQRMQNERDKVKRRFM